MSADIKTPTERGASKKRVTGVEPATSCLASTRSSQLSYTRVGRGKCTTAKGGVNGASENHCCSSRILPHDPQSSLHQSLEHGVRCILVKFNVNLSPEVIGEIVQLAPCCNVHEQGLRLFVDREFSDANCIRYHLDRAS